MKSSSLPLIALPALVLATSVSSAQVTLAEFQFNSTTDWISSIDTEYADTAELVRATGSITSTGLHYFRNGTGDVAPETLADSIAANMYLGFTVTPTGHELDFTSLRFDFGASNATTSIDPYTVEFAVFSSVTGFAAGDLLATGSFSLPKSSGSGALWLTPSPEISLSALPALQNVVNPVEFRLVFWDNTSTSTSNVVLRFDNIEVLATPTAVPEPGTFALTFALGTMAFVALRRRRAPR